MIERFRESLNYQAKAMELRTARQELLAANVVNADTPGYRAVDADFSAALARATGADAPAGPARIRKEEVRELPIAQGARDGNGVDLDAERARFAENAIRYEAAVKTLNHQVKSLLTVISG